MSNFKSCFTTIKNIQPHPDPETTSLEIATVYEYNIVIKKGSMNVGDIVYYIPIDSVLDSDLENMIFPPDSKIKLSGGRVRQARIRKFPSQGLLVQADHMGKFLYKKGFNFKFESELEKDLSSIVGITKFEPPTPKDHQGLPITSKKRLAEHPCFHKYNGITNIRWGDPFKEDELVSIQLKLHGSNARLGNLPRKPRNIFEKILKYFNLLPKYEYRYGSNNVDITFKNGKSNFYGSDIWGKAFQSVNARNKVKPNEVIYGEIIGEGIQKNYHYGHKEPHFILFDVKVFTDDNDTKGRWLNPDEVKTYATERGFEFALELYRGNYKRSIADSMVSGADPYYPQHKVREGIVVKSIDNYNDSLSDSYKKVRKYINPVYLDDKSNTDNH